MEFAEDYVGTIRALTRIGQSKQPGTAAKDIVLTQVAKNHVIAAISFDVVIAVRGIFKGGNHNQHTIGVAVGLHPGSSQPAVNGTAA